MSDRPRGGYNARGGGGRGGGGGGGRGGGGRGGGRGGHSSHTERPKKESILDLGKYMDQKIRVKYSGGREVVGTLKGYDPLLNLVLDETEEYLRDPEDGRLLDQTRNLGLIVCRGPAVILISPMDGTLEIANPFIQEEEAVI
ncbi:Sm-like protein lsm7 [Entomortierella chlamydospora]|uniref:Sm-like protein lsm7 n=1 Tax=Entomortierella chlamydospora TaxID=101097 RepID=A0A9P6N491_9FUNG|nr:Sm-like protein lsm7 [Entomortierella chlamydospora]KAG0024199.1 Sm-like protein lsm7 [Entomortierella chlamydospora]